LDRNEQVVGLLQSNSDRNKNIYYDDVLTEILSSGADTFTFTSIPDKETSRKLTVGNYIAFKKDNKFKLLQIIEVNENKEDVLTKEVYCEGAGLELINTVYSGSKMDAVNVERFLKNILQDTNWKVGHVSSNLTKTLSLDVKEKEVYSIIQEYLYDFEAEIDFRVEIKGNRIVGRYIDVYSKRGRNNGRRLEINRDIKGITRKVSLANYATKLIGEGKNGLNFRDISMTGTIEKPLGQNFVTNDEAYSRINNKGKHITRKFTYDTEDAYELLRQTHKALKEYSEPKVTYEVDADILNFDDIEIGDYVSISDLSFTPPLLVTARISELETSKTNKYSNKAVLSNFNEVRSGISSIFPILGEDIVSGSIGEEQMNPDYVDSIISDSVNATMVKTEILLADKANIKDLDVTNANIDNLKANVAEIDELLAGNITADNIQADSITSNHIQANSIDTKHLKANSIDADKIQANSIVSNHIQANSVTSNHIQANTITSGHIQTGSITAGSGIIAEGAIGNAQISSIDAGKIEAGTIDTSKVTVQGSNGHLRIKGNRLQVFNGTGNQAKERVSVGDVNGDGSIYGLRVRGADGQTILLDENGVTNEGLTDGSITNEKISDDANIDGAKLNINSVVSKINEDGTETIQGTKIEVDGTTLNTKLSTITNKQTEDSNRITQAQSQITANTNAIKLKVDEQTYQTDKTNMTSQMNKNTSEISTMKGQIALKVEQADIENVKSELEGTITSINTRLSAAEIKITDSSITNVVQSSQFVKDINGKITENTSNISKVEQTANSISSEVSDLSGKYTQIKQTVDSIDLTGKVSFSDLSTSGKTTINGGNITTGTLDASRVNVTNLNASNIKSGKLSANYIDATNLSVKGELLSGQINGIGGMKFADGAVISSCESGASGYKGIQISAPVIKLGDKVEINRPTIFYDVTGKNNSSSKTTTWTMSSTGALTCASASLSGTLNVKNGVIYGMNNLALARGSIYIPSFGTSYTYDFIRGGNSSIAFADSGPIHFLYNGSKSSFIAGGTVYLPHAGHVNCDHFRLGAGIIASPSSGSFHFLTASGNTSPLYAGTLYSADVLALNEPMVMSNNSVFDKINSIDVIETKNGLRLHNPISNINAIDESPDVVKTVYNEEKDEIKTSIDYTSAISTLWKAVQELKQENDELKEKIKDIYSKL
ncbi:MAG TPA: hypothetical protein K8U79_04225, partial [Clostridium perfringens]|nr:hypothetical protein [Clostridium perfringens]